MHKNFSKSLSKKIEVSSKIILFLFLLSSSLTFAQPGFDDDVDDETVAAPLDSSSILLLSAGSIFGIYFLKKNQKSEVSKI